MPPRASKSAGGGMTDRGEAPRRGRKRPPRRQTLVRGLRIACRNISVSLKDAGPRVAGSTEKDALRRGSTHWHGGSRHVRLRRPLDKKSRDQFKTSNDQNLWMALGWVTIAPLT